MSKPPTTPNWVGCGAGGAFRAKASVIAMASEDPATPYNVRLDMKNESVKAYYFELKVHKLEGHLSVGVVSKDEFQAGWKVKGMFYNGNLINGHETLKVGWGPGYTAGDTIGVRYAKAEKEHMTVTEVSFFKNGDPLGVGYRLKDNPNFYQPCMGIRGSCQLVLEVPQSVPPVNIDFSIPKNFFGDWKLVEAYRGTADDYRVTFPDNKEFIMKFYVDTATSVHMTFRISNSIMGRAQIIEQTDALMTIEHGEFLNTMMPCPRELRELERILEKEEKTTVEFNQEEKQLILSGPEMKTIWAYKPRVPEPLTQY